jgi:hypothetical protein
VEGFNFNGFMKGYGRHPANPIFQEATWHLIFELKTKEEIYPMSKNFPKFTIPSA